MRARTAAPTERTTGAPRRSNREGFPPCELERRSRSPEHAAPEPHGSFQNLTARQRELLELLAHGIDNLQIAAHLGLSEKTVRNKVSAVFDKLHVTTRAQAIVLARNAGFGTGPLAR
jgi:DNA-binding NarL/FixJ family response regulator